MTTNVTEDKALADMRKRAVLGLLCLLVVTIPMGER
jgi:hypothetical protein